jgi:hypothetical protein
VGVKGFRKSSGLVPDSGWGSSESKDGDFQNKGMLTLPGFKSKSLKLATPSLGESLVQVSDQLVSSLDSYSQSLSSNINSFNGPIEIQHASENIVPMLPSEIALNLLDLKIKAMEEKAESQPALKNVVKDTKEVLSYVSSNLIHDEIGLKQSLRDTMYFEQIIKLDRIICEFNNADKKIPQFNETLDFLKDTFKTVVGLYLMEDKACMMDELLKSNGTEQRHVIIELLIDKFIENQLITPNEKLKALICLREICQHSFEEGTENQIFLRLEDVEKECFRQRFEQTADSRIDSVVNEVGRLLGSFDVLASQRDAVLDNGIKKMDKLIQDFSEEGACFVSSGNLDMRFDPYIERAEEELYFLLKERYCEFSDEKEHRIAIEHEMESLINGLRRKFSAELMDISVSPKKSAYLEVKKSIQDAYSGLTGPLDKKELIDEARKFICGYIPGTPKIVEQVLNLPGVQDVLFSLGSIKLMEDIETTSTQIAAVNKSLASFIFSKDQEKSPKKLAELKSLLIMKDKLDAKMNSKLYSLTSQLFTVAGFAIPVAATSFHIVSAGMSVAKNGANLTSYLYKSAVGTLGQERCESAETMVNLARLEALEQRQLLAGESVDTSVITLLRNMNILVERKTMDEEDAFVSQSGSLSVEKGIDIDPIVLGEQMMDPKYRTVVQNNLFGTLNAA